MFDEKIASKSDIKMLQKDIEMLHKKIQFNHWMLGIVIAAVILPLIRDFLL